MRSNLGPPARPDPRRLQSSPQAPAASVLGGPESTADIQSLGNRAVQRLIQRTRAEVQRPGPVGLEGGELGGDLQSRIDSARGGGRPLDRGVSAQIGSALGTDFSSVRVHTDSQADRLNRSLSAKAFTLGRDVFFSQGAYAPGTSGGKELLAHELTHGVQRGSAD